MSNADRWPPARKKEILASLRTGMISVKQACTIHGLTEAEIMEWLKKYGSERR